MGTTATARPGPADRGADVEVELRPDLDGGSASGRAGTPGPGPQPTFTDDELAAQALAADPDAPLPPDAVPFAVEDDDPLLPSWYMPAPVAPGRAGRRRHKVAAVSVSLGLAAINCAGFCITYGHLVLA